MHTPLFLPAIDETLENSISLFHQSSNHRIHPAQAVVFFDDWLMLVDDEADGFEESSKVCDVVERR